MRTSAIAKAILIGEHAVVHGVPAIAVPISARRTEVEVTLTDAPEILVEDARGLETALARQMTCLALEQRGRHGRGARVRISSTIPLGSGLGSSAALGVALVRALSEPSVDSFEVARRANELEKLAHGTPSGIDASVIAFERPILFEKGRPPLPLKIASPFRFGIGILPRTGTTSSLIAHVRDLMLRFPGRFSAVLDRVRAAVSSALEALTKNHGLADLAAALEQGRGALHELGVSTKETEMACDAAVAAGALGAKLSGAGGGGVVIALLGESSCADRVLKALRGAGAFDAFVAELSAS